MITRRFNTYRAKKKTKYYRSLYTKLIIFGFILVLTGIINIITTPEYLWFLWIGLGFAASFFLYMLNYFIQTKLFNRKWEARFFRKQMKKYEEA